ncbi:MAG TPA: helix-turn-helix transcriptional regulator [Kiritimatiellia bacterium]|nr:helix-turn-helix transcriptional regulator [Kiritimatiellia bacterium]
MKDRRLKVARVAAGLTQMDVAQSAGVSEALISKYETRRLTPPRGVQEKIAARLGVCRWEVF